MVVFSALNSIQCVSQKRKLINVFNRLSQFKSAQLAKLLALRFNPTLLIRVLYEIYQRLSVRILVLGRLDFILINLSPRSLPLYKKFVKITIPLFSPSANLDQAIIRAIRLIFRRLCSKHTLKPKDQAYESVLVFSVCTLLME